MHSQALWYGSLMVIAAVFTGVTIQVNCLHLPAVGAVIQHVETHKAADIQLTHECTRCECS